MRMIHSAVVVAALTFISSGAFAQVLVQGGEAHDANTRAGSGGYNTQRRDRMLVNPNDVALGNATGGREFRGNLTRDPSQPFGGRSNLPSDRFARRANPTVNIANANVRPSATGNYVQPYYSSAPTGQPPAGFRLDPLSGQYRPPTQIQAGSEDITFGVPPGTPIVRPDASGAGQLVLPSTLRPEDAFSESPMMIASPLLGVREAPTLADEDRLLLTRSSDLPGANAIDAATLRQLRTELRQAMLTDPQVAERLRQAEAKSALAEQNRPGAIVQQPLGSSAQIPSTYLPSAAVQQLPTGVTDTFAPPDPSTRNPLLMELRKAEAERAKAAAEAKADAKKNPTKGTTRPAAKVPVLRGAAPADPNAPANSSAKPDDKNPTNAPDTTPPPEDKETPAGQADAKVGYVKPIQVDSLSKMQTQKGLQTILASAEKLMADGKYASAADHYETARRFARGDETLLIGRAHAELAGGFFARSYDTLRQAVASDPAVLAAQYDLRKAVGETRLQTIVNDLKKLALDNPKDPRPLAVLAYLSYNAGEEDQAISLLDEAARRNLSGKDDGFVSAMRTRWQAKAK